MTFSLELLMVIRPNSTGMVPGWSPTKISKNRFSKYNFQKSSFLKLQSPELSYLIYNIIKRSSTKVVQIMLLGPVLYYWLHCDF